MRIVNWNIEWMNNWFVGYGELAFRQDNQQAGITDVAALCTRTASVVNALDPDVLTIEEGPSDIHEMELFVTTYLQDAQGNAAYVVLGGLDGGAQKLYTLVKKQGEFKGAVIASDDRTLELQDAWSADIDGDLVLEGYEFTRLPLVVEGTMGVGGPKLKIVSLHTKSKYVNNGKALWDDPDTRMQFVIAAMKNRRRISSEAMRTRRYLNELLSQGNDPYIVVTGDFNDGPGIDYFERYYLTHNVTDILLGSIYYPAQAFKHAFIDKFPQGQCFTAVFDDFIDSIQGRPLLLDHILLSPELAPMVQDGGIAHQEFDAAADNTASGRQRKVSDHRPTYVDLSA